MRASFDLFVLLEVRLVMGKMVNSGIEKSYAARKRVQLRVIVKDDVLLEG